MGELYTASDKRYDHMKYNHVVKSGLKFPAVSLGFWHNFGNNGFYDNIHERAALSADCESTQIFCFRPDNRKGRCKKNTAGRPVWVVLPSARLRRDS